MHATIIEEGDEWIGVNVVDNDGADHVMVRCLTRPSVPAYHDYGADVDGYRAEDTFNAGVAGQSRYVF